MNVNRLLVGIAFAGALAAAACGGGNSAPASPTALSTAPSRETSQNAPTSPTSTSAAPTSTPAALTSPAATPQAALSPQPSPASTVPAATTPPATTAPAPTTAPPLPAVTSITVTAVNLAFDRTVIRVKAGTTLTATFVNNDVGIDHNLTFSLPGLGHPTCTGPCTTTQTFTPARPGAFSFFCTLHAEMFGDFIVD